MESAVSLTNQLKRLQLELDAESKKQTKDGDEQPLLPTTAQIEEVFKAYQKESYGRAYQAVNLSWWYTRLSCWNNVVFEFFTRHVMRYLANVMADYGLVAVARDGLVLHKIAEPNHETGKIPWKYPEFKSSI